MKKLFKATQYFYILLRSKISKQYPQFKTYPIDEIEKRERKSKLKLIFSTLLGNLYYKFNSVREKNRIWKYKTEKEVKKHEILVEFIRHSKNLISYLFFALLMSLLLDWLLSISLPSLRTNKLLVQYFSLP